MDKLIDELDFSDGLSRETREWLLYAFLRRKYIHGRTLDYWLGLLGPGRRQPATVLAMIQRNRYLWQAVAAIAIDPGQGLYPRCERLAGHVTECQKAWNQGYRNTPAPPEAWPEWKRNLFLAWRQGNVPATARGLYEALKKTGASFQYDDATLGAPDNSKEHLNEVVSDHPGKR
ncbi:MAG: hypothetical protein LBE85_13730 [Candidatus Accumulibacter sp.]|nr:hypothetical protein [Accumulibacter sp.]